MAGILGVAVWLVGSGTAQQPAPVEGVRRPTVPMKSAAEWQKQFPFKSVAEQLASEAQRAQQTPPAVTAPSLTKEALKSLDDAERLYTASSPWGNMRRESLKLLHSKEVEEFVKRRIGPDQRREGGTAAHGAERGRTVGPAHAAVPGGPARPERLRVHQPG
jgi:hypothetical protein